MLRKAGKDAGMASEALLRLSVAEKNEMLFQRGINFNDLPGWQKRGCGVYWREEEKEGFNPVTGEKVVAIRRRVRQEMELPMKEGYGEFVGGLLKE
jgi:tRNA(His) 5'-end guanylyltransferase